MTRRKKVLSIAQLLILSALNLTPQIAAASHYVVTPLVSDLPLSAPHTDPDLINPWGLFFVPTGNFWVADNGSSISTLYKPDGTKVNSTIRVSNSPTGAKFNPSDVNFIIGRPSNAHPARFLFATEEGKILGFNSFVNQNRAVVAVDNSASGAVYKGLDFGLGTSCCNKTLLFAADFFNGKIDMFDAKFHNIGTLKDLSIPAGYAPFNAKIINRLLYVTYAKQKLPENRDDEPGIGHGYVDLFSLSGNFVRRLISKGKLNSPWALALAPDNFGKFGEALLVGNFGDGKINAYNPQTGTFLGQLTDADDNPIVIDGLWALEFDSNGMLYFSAGPNDEENGLVGTITPSP